MNKEFLPKCLTGNETFAITNRNCLVPCCYVDDKTASQTKVMKDLVAVSNLDDYDSIADILSQDEWKDFYKVLKRAHRRQKTMNIPSICSKICYVEKGKLDNVRQENWLTQEDK